MTSFGCALGKKTGKTTHSANGHPSERKPLEDCPKPLTYRDFIHLRYWNKKSTKK